MVVSTEEGGAEQLAGRHLDRYRAQQETRSWSKLFGRRRTYRNLYGKVSGYHGDGLDDALDRSGEAGRPGDQYLTVGGGSVDAPLGADALELNQYVRAIKPKRAPAERGDVTRHLPAAAVSEGAAPRSAALQAELDLDLSVTRNASRVFQKRHKYNDLISMQQKRRLVDESYEKELLRECADARETPRAAAPLASWAGSAAYDYGLDYRTLIDGISTRNRAYAGQHKYTFGDTDYELALVRHLGNKDKRLTRAASLSRMEVEEERIDYELEQSRRRVCRARSLTSDLDPNDPDRYLPNQVLRGHLTGENDIANQVLGPKEAWEPDRVNISYTADGRKKMVYSSERDRGEADQATNHAMQKIQAQTQLMQNQMSSLETFVRRNRSLFPEDTTIHQQTRYFRLSAEQLRRMGEREDAEIYGVKLREKLVVPPGFDAGELLNKYYKRGGAEHSEVEVEYNQKLQCMQEAADDQEKKHSAIMQEMRSRVEEDYSRREERQALDEVHQPRQVQHALRVKRIADKNDHVTAYLTPDYIKAIYSQEGIPYDPDESEVYRSKRSARYDGPRTAPDEHAERRRPKKKFDTAPQFSSKLRDKRVVTGSTIRFNASVSGYPEPDAIWFKGNRMVHEDDRHMMQNKYGLLSLEISNVQLDDAGTYTVKAVNTEGESASTAELEVKDLIDDRGDVTKKPLFIMEANNVTVDVGERAVVEAQASGVPTPTFRWMKDNFPVRESERVHLYSDEQGRARLTLRDTQRGDAGLYWCVAENSVGQSKSCAGLRVNQPAGTKPAAAPKYSDDVTDEVKPLDEPAEIVAGKKPYFLSRLPGEVTVHVGDPLSLLCAVDGDPRPKVTWIKDGARELSYTKRHRVTVEGDKHVLNIPSVLQTDLGHYMAVVENLYGKASVDCFVNVIPARPSDSDDVGRQTNKLDKLEYEYDVLETEGQMKQAPLFVKRLPTTHQVTSGDSLQLDCRLQDTSPPRTTDTLITVTRVRPRPESPPVTTPTQSEDAVPPPAVSSPRDAVVPETVTPATTPLSPDGVRPEFELALVDKTVRLNGIVKLSVKVRGQPYPAVTWDKEQRRIEDDGRHELFLEKGCHCLEMYHVEAADGGRYRATAANDQGQATCCCTLTVLDRNGRPLVTDIPEEEEESGGLIAKHIENMTVTKGASAGFECVVQGDALTAAWRKDGAPVVQSENVKCASREGKHLLVVLEAGQEDQGQYEFTVTDGACAARSTATLTVKEPERFPSASPEPPRFVKELEDMTAALGESLEVSVKLPSAAE